MKKILKKFNYEPLKDFGGWSECFTKYEVN